MVHDVIVYESNAYSILIFLLLNSFSMWNTMMGTSLLALAWGISQVICSRFRSDILPINQYSEYVIITQRDTAIYTLIN